MQTRPLRVAARDGARIRSPFFPPLSMFPLNVRPFKLPLGAGLTASAAMVSCWKSKKQHSPRKSKEHQFLFTGFRRPSAY